MTFSRRGDGLPAEQDSFLDIVANLVGILIILVVVFGAQIGATLTGQSDQQASELEASVLRHRDALDQAKSRLSRYLGEQEEWEEVSVRQAQLIEQKRLQRHLAIQQIGFIQAELDSREQQLSENERQRLRLQRELRDEVNAVTELERRLETIRVASVEEVTARSKEIIEHYPTPIAKTVFEQEVHFQLQANRLVHVPFDELFQKLRSTWEVHAATLPVWRSTTETLGPIAGFRLQYELASQSRVVPTANGQAVSREVGVQRFWLLPTQVGMGETLEEALGGQSRFLQELQRHSPENTTLSVWVYPDSYLTFMELRKFLISKGYRVAVWPLTADQKISSSPNGLRSSAQ